MNECINLAERKCLNLAERYSIIDLLCKSESEESLAGRALAAFASALTKRPRLIRQPYQTCRAKRLSRNEATGYPEAAGDSLELGGQGIKNQPGGEWRSRKAACRLKPEHADAPHSIKIGRAEDAAAEDPQGLKLIAEDQLAYLPVTFFTKVLASTMLIP